MGQYNKMEESAILMCAHVYTYGSYRYYNAIYYENEFESELKTHFADMARLR